MLYDTIKRFKGFSRKQYDTIKGFKRFSGVYDTIMGFKSFTKCNMTRLKDFMMIYYTVKRFIDLKNQDNFVYELCLGYVSFTGVTKFLLYNLLKSKLKPPKFISKPSAILNTSR